MNICVVNAYFPPFAPGGAEYSTQELCRHLALAGHRVVAVVPDFMGNPRREVRDGYEIVWTASPVHLQPGQGSDTTGYIGSRRFVHDMTTALLAETRSMAADVIHAQHKVTYEPAVLAARKLGITAVGTVRDTGILCPPGVCMMDDQALLPRPCRTFLAFLQCTREYQQRAGQRLSALQLLRYGLSVWRTRGRSRQWLQMMDGVTAVSEALRDLLLLDGVLTSERLHAIHNFPTDIPRFTPAEIADIARQFGLGGRRYFVVAGKKSLGKGTPVAVEAAHQLVSRLPEACVVFVGKGQDPGPSHGIVSWPSVSQPVLHRLMQGASGILIPSVWFEPLPRAMLDALCLCLPIVATCAGGQKEGILDGRNGFVVPKNDPARLAQAMEAILAFSVEQMAEVRRASRELLENRFSPARILAQLESVYVGETSRSSTPATTVVRE